MSKLALTAAGASITSIAAACSSGSFRGRVYIGIKEQLIVGLIAVFDPNSGDTMLVVDQTALWGKTGDWGAASVYGSSAFIPFVDGSTALWGKTALLGQDDPDAFTALWGQTALWGKGNPGSHNCIVGPERGLRRLILAV